MLPKLTRKQMISFLETSGYFDTVDSLWYVNQFRRMYYNSKPYSDDYKVLHIKGVLTGNKMVAHLMDPHLRSLGVRYICIYVYESQNDYVLE